MATTINLRAELESVERNMMQAVLDSVYGNTTHAAERLGFKRTTFGHRLAQLNKALPRYDMPEALPTIDCIVTRSGNVIGLVGDGENGDDLNACIIAGRLRVVSVVASRWPRR